MTRRKRLRTLTAARRDRCKPFTSYQSVAKNLMTRNGIASPLVIDAKMSCLLSKTSPRCEAMFCRECPQPIWNAGVVNGPATKEQVSCSDLRSAFLNFQAAPGGLQLVAMVSKVVVSPPPYLGLQSMRWQKRPSVQNRMQTGCSGSVIATKCSDAALQLVSEGLGVGISWSILLFAACP